MNSATNTKRTNLNEYFKRHHLPGAMYPRAPRITCADDFSISVQANEDAYCSPRENTGPWHQVECGFPSAVPDGIMEYAEEGDKPTETVYGYVPIELVEKLIDDHGGIKSAASGEKLQS